MAFWVLLSSLCLCNSSLNKHFMASEQDSEILKNSECQQRSKFVFYNSKIIYTDSRIFITTVNLDSPSCPNTHQPRDLFSSDLSGLQWRMFKIVPPNQKLLSRLKQRLNYHPSVLHMQTHQNIMMSTVKGYPSPDTTIWHQSGGVIWEAGWSGIQGGALCWRRSQYFPLEECVNKLPTLESFGVLAF